MVSLGLLLTVILAHGLTWALTPNVRCPVDDKDGNDHTNTTAPYADSRGIYVQCSYWNGARPCVYYTDGTFLMGSSNCPGTIAFFDFQCLAFSDAEMVASPLITNTTYNDFADHVLLCSFEKTASEGCHYSTTNGSYIQGDTKSCPPTVNPANLPSSNYSCVPNSKAQYGGTLQGSSVATNQSLVCAYETEQCLYDTTGNLTSGVDCPSRAILTQDPTMPPCPQTDAKNVDLNATYSTPGAGTMACLYGHNLCTYTLKTGKLKSGPPSTCPQNATMPSDSASGGGPVGAVFAGGGDSAAASGGGAGDSHGSDSKIPQPVIIALLAMNGFLVLSLLVIGGVWFSNRRASDAPRRYKEVVPVDNHDSYYDAPVVPYNPPSRT
ncbi:hypothetical protein B0H15DRAFT_373678 [Mycena belliarum]|uniref:Uncharacterized protein n=1 Tax=Mycena belliarum TaxID=1033014 RepID=A0AAD6TZW6_9AGAR|nr:hypothetical protein B0H15DRAFT_373678 [Mycena belliae]